MRKVRVYRNPETTSLHDVVVLEWGGYVEKVDGDDEEHHLRIQIPPQGYDELNTALEADPTVTAYGWPTAKSKAPKPNQARPPRRAAKSQGE